MKLSTIFFLILSIIFSCSLPTSKAEKTNEPVAEETKTPIETEVKTNDVLGNLILKYQKGEMTYEELIAALTPIVVGDEKFKQDILAKLKTLKELKGKDGVNGSQGKDGMKGDKGDVGVMGLAGVMGVEGSNGLDGIDGTDGVNCFDNLNDVNGDNIVDVNDCVIVVEEDFLEITSTPQGTDAVGNGWSYQVVVNTQGTDLTYLLFKAPESFSISETGMITYIPTNDTGNAEIIIGVSDKGNIATQTFVINRLDAMPPEFEDIDYVEISEYFDDYRNCSFSYYDNSESEIQCTVSTISGERNYEFACEYHFYRDVNVGTCKYYSQQNGYIGNEEATKISCCDNNNNCVQKPVQINLK